MTENNLNKLTDENMREYERFTNAVRRYAWFLLWKRKLGSQRTIELMVPKTRMIIIDESTDKGTPLSDSMLPPVNRTKLLDLLRGIKQIHVKGSRGAHYESMCEGVRDVIDQIAAEVTAGTLE
jgi:hypothetical protein